MQQPLQAQPGQQPPPQMNLLTNIWQYKPFTISFIASIVFMILYITFMVLAIQNCTECLFNDNFLFYCYEGGVDYCCSLTDSSGEYSCSPYLYRSCILDNSDCSTWSTLSWVFGTIFFISLVCMVVASCKFRRLKQEMLLRQLAQAQPVYLVNPQAPQPGAYQPVQPQQQGYYPPQQPQNYQQPQHQVHQYQEPINASVRTDERLH